MPMATDASLLATYVDHLVAEGRLAGVVDVLPVLRAYGTMLAARGVGFTTATKADVEAYRAHLASPAASPAKGSIARTTQGTRLGTVRSFHAWLRRRGHALSDPAATVSRPSVPRRQVTADHLSQQEARALLLAAGTAVEQHRRGSRGWAIALRDLAMVSLALATGRRATGLCTMRDDAIDVEARSVRVDREKGSPGRVLPVVEWAMAVIAAYREQARPVLMGRSIGPFLFPGRDPVAPIATRTWDETIHRLNRAAAAASPELEQLGGKVISSHSLRVTFAVELFNGGCDIRTINEMMLHRRLSTTASYTPLSFDDLRQGLIAHHPRA